MIVINFKNYVYRKSALELAKKIEKYLPDAIICASAFDISPIKSYTQLNVFAQHIDAKEGKRNTGFILSEVAKANGASGTLLNHSEHPLDFKEIKKAILLCNKNSLKTIVCVPNLKIAKQTIKLEPWAIAFENPELIASGKSITFFRANGVKEFSNILKKTKIISLCGAGINSTEDVRKAYELGCRGILVSSAIANVELRKAEILLKEIVKTSPKV